MKRVIPFFRNVRKEITKAPLYYFSDIGLRNYIAGLFGVPAVEPLRGHVVENFVFNRLDQSVASKATSVHFWRTRDHAEVDFVLRTGMDTTPVEAKYTSLGKPAVPRSLRNFLRVYQPKRAYIIHLGERMRAKAEEHAVSFIPFWEDIVF